MYSVLFTPTTSTRADYNIYLPASYTSVWGSGAGGTSTVSGGFTLGASERKSVTHTGAARIPAGQTAAHVGSYADTVIVTISY
jgi:spore coat protein U-like protein